MKTNQELLNERTERFTKTLALEKADRAPIILMIDGFCAVHTGVKMSDFCSSVKRSNEVMLDSIKRLGNVDGVTAAFAVGPIFPLIFMAKVKVPGRELPENMLWQLDESEMMTPEDYDTIINKGWGNFMPDYLINRLGFDLPGAAEQLSYSPQAIQNFNDAGYVVYSPLVTITVNEYLSGGRSMSKFMRDLYKMPDKVEAALEVIQKESLEQLRQQVRAIKPTVVFVSPARGASEFFAPKLWERFVWKYLKETADMIIEEGAICDIHADGNWERDLDYFLDFPKGKIVFECDGATDIYKIKEKLGDKYCIKGDIPAALMVLGTPDEVYNFCRKRIEDMGTGYILSNGCTCPMNAKLENVEAMIAAATGK
ncbi:MAG TPA: uroporphyrinogen decarboxylase family protein [Anaerovoracaceae bacterium]|nr:uroporphyrinogen decarboxylase family protein [Anaerovoracaceae bacterium]